MSAAVVVISTEERLYVSFLKLHTITIGYLMHVSVIIVLCFSFMNTGWKENDLVCISLHNSICTLINQTFCCKYCHQRTKISFLWVAFVIHCIQRGWERQRFLVRYRQASIPGILIIIFDKHRYWATISLQPWGTKHKWI